MSQTNDRIWSDLAIADAKYLKTDDECKALTLRVAVLEAGAGTSALVGTGISPDARASDMRGKPAAPSVPLDTRPCRCQNKPPTMPCMSKAEVHWKRHTFMKLVPYACVARPVSKAELERTPAAREARDAEGNRLQNKKVWDLDTVREWREVAREARVSGKEIHIGRIFGICVEKNHELPKSDKRRKYKYRIVFQGNNVVTCLLYTSDAADE